MTTKKPVASTAKKATARRTAARKTTTRRRTTTTRRRAPGLPTTIGGALGALVVTSLLGTSWPVRIAIVVLAVVLGLGYILRSRRAEIRAGVEAARTEGPPPAPADPDVTPTPAGPSTTPPTTPPAPGDAPQ